MVQQYFTKKRPLAVGIVGMGVSFGTLSFPPILRLLIQSLGWRGGLVLMAGVLMQGLVFAALLRPLQTQISERYFELNLFKDPKFALLIVSRTLTYFGSFIMYKYTVTNAVGIPRFTGINSA